MLLQASHLLDYEAPNPSQAALRRAVSTAYYALFHLLVNEAADRWANTSEARTGVTRAFSHGQMKKISDQFAKGKWEDWNQTRRSVPPELVLVARIFTELQSERHHADYNVTVTVTQTEARTLVDGTKDAFAYWVAIRRDPMAANYLLAMLIGNPR